MSKEIKFGFESREAIFKGVNILADAVKITLGPCGKNVMIEKENGLPSVTKDGVSVAKSITLENKFENLGAQMCKEVASKTNDIAGDGTTTATVLAQAIAREGFKNVAAGAVPIKLKHGIDSAVNDIVKNIDKISKKIENKESISQIATISANNDEEIGNLIADAMEKVGENGVITVDESKTAETSLDIVEGMKFDRGYCSPYFITDANKMICELEDPYILLYDKKISKMSDIIPYLEFAINNNKSILFIAEDIDGEALSTLIINKIRGSLKVAAVKAPGFGSITRENLEDIAILTGATLITEDTGIKLEDIDPSTILGQAKLIKITSKDTTIIDGKGNKKNINSRITQLKNTITEDMISYQKENIQKRIAKLTGGVAIIHVGAATEVEMNEKKDRIDDAIHATKAAVEEGIVAGGGIALIRAAKNLKSYSNDIDVQTGYNLVLKAIEEPLKQIVHNAGYESSIILNRVKELENNIGFNAKNNEYQDLITCGIIDPALVTKTALINAASIASLLLTTECVIVNNIEKNDSNISQIPMI